VEVEYAPNAAGHRLHKLETRVPPGAGEANDFGAVESVGDDSLVAASVTAVPVVWRIGGQEYAVTAATRIDDATGALTVGRMVLVNSALAADGSRVATAILGLGANNQVFLPLIR
jgi:hypothetical protein